MKLENGDMFEFQNAAWLPVMLPFYERIWQDFVGHNGQGWPADLLGLNHEEERNRRRFYQAHYSFARSFFKLCMIAEELEKSLGEASDYLKFEREQDRLMTYALYIGNVRDMFKTMEEALHSPHNLYGALQSFYAQRSHLLHGPRLPVRVDDGLLMIPRIAGENKTDTEWDNNCTWTEIPPERFVFLRDFIGDSTREFALLVNESHGKIYDAAMKYFAGKKIATPEPAGLTEPAPVSGTWAIPAISAYHPPSGDVSFRPSSPGSPPCFTVSSLD